MFDFLAPFVLGTFVDWDMWGVINSAIDGDEYLRASLMQVVEDKS